jgi:Xaa-Pro dipeptidase
MLDPTLCRRRQRRLLDVLAARRLDAAVVSARHHVYWLTGHWPFWLHEAAAVLRADGHLTLLAANAPVACPAADDVRAFAATRFGTQDQEQPATLAAAVAPLLAAGRRMGFDTGGVASLVARAAVARNATTTAVDFVELDPDLHQLRRRKEPDELALMRKAIDCTRAMYERARQIIAPGVDELTVFTELQAAAVRTAGEPLTPMHLGNDYACGVGGGPPRAGRVARAGEIYILDLGPAYRGYFADNARAFAVGGNPTDAQAKTHAAIVSVFPLVERLAKPGLRCRDLFVTGRQHLLDTTGRTLGHHLGHGVGLQPHEYPHVNPEWDDVLAVGDVFTIEPGLYGPDLAGGIRVENQYLVTETGVENLTPFPLGMV